MFELFLPSENDSALTLKFKIQKVQILWRQWEPFESFYRFLQTDYLRKFNIFGRSFYLRKKRYEDNVNLIYRKNDSLLKFYE